MIKTKLRKQTAHDRGEAPEKCLADNVQRAMEAYFEDLDGHEASNLHGLVLRRSGKTILRGRYEIYAGKYNPCRENTGPKQSDLT